MPKHITDQQREQIVALRNKRSGREIAKLVGVSPALVSMVLNGKDNSKAAKRAAAKAGLPAPARGTPVTASAADPLPDVPEDVPEGADLALVDRWIALVEAAAHTANEDGNMTAFASLTAKLVSLLEHRRKVQPVPKVDPNENPDMVAMGEMVWARLIRALGVEG